MNSLLTNRERERFASLKTVKGRRKEGLFLIEGERALGEYLDSFPNEVLVIIALEEWLERNSLRLDCFNGNVFVVSRKDLKEISSLTTIPEVIGVCRIHEKFIQPSKLLNELVIALDRVQDPGNLGTIIRIADWFGIRHIVASNDTVDCYNPKVVQSTMGALSRVNFFQVPDLSQYLHEYRQAGGLVYGTFLDGQDVYDAPLSTNGLIVMGNEGNGVSHAVAQEIDRRLLIPAWPQHASHVESLNVAVSTGIIVGIFRNKTKIS